MPRELVAYVVQNLVADVAALDVRAVDEDRGGVRIEEAVRVTRSLEDIYLETTETAGEEQ